MIDIKGAEVSIFASSAHPRNEHSTAENNFDVADALSGLTAGDVFVHDFRPVLQNPEVRWTACPCKSCKHGKTVLAKILRSFGSELPRAR